MPIAHSSWAQTDPIAQAVKDCSRGDTIQTCPNYCRTACTSTDFLLDNTDACDTAMLALPDSDAAQCPKPEDIGIVSLDSCIAEKSSIPLEPSRVIQRNPQRLQLFNEFFADRPDCAASSLALEQMFSCLSGETTQVQTEYQALGSLGIGDSPLNSDRLIELACSVDEDRLIEIDIGASAIQGRAVQLGEYLGSVASCRRSYASWLDARADGFCSGRDFNNCEAVVGVFQGLLQRSLDGAEEQNRQISTVVDGLEQDLGSILSLALVPRSACPTP